MLRIKSASSIVKNSLVLGLFFCAFVVLSFFSSLFFDNKPVYAGTGINQQINFQGRLLTAEGATVPDGYYNVEFKIYKNGDGLSEGDTTGSPAGTLLWTEDYLNYDSHGIVVVNGFLSVQLGSITAFGSNVDWNQDTLWLSINIAGTGTGCTTFANCTPDGEMLPMKRLTSSPYSLNSRLLNGMTSSQFVQLAQGVQEDSSNNNSIFINKTGSGDTVRLQSGGSDTFIIANTGSITSAGTFTFSGTTPTITTSGGTTSQGLAVSTGNATAGTSGNITIDNGSFTSGTPAISIGTTNARSISIGNSNSGSISMTSATVTFGNNMSFSGATTRTITGPQNGLTVIGGTAADDTLTIEGNSASSDNTPANPNLIFKVGNNAGTTAMTIYNNGSITANGTVTIGIVKTNNLTPTAALTLGATAQTFALTGATGSKITVNSEDFTFPASGGTLCTTITCASSVAGFLVKVPTATADNTVTSTADSVVGLTINGTSGTAATAVNIIQSGGAANLTMSNTGATSSSIMSITHTTSTYTGTALLMNIAAGSGSFSGNFIDLQKNNVSQFKISNSGAITIGSFTTAGIVTNTSAGVLQSTTALSSALGGTGWDSSSASGLIKVSSGSWGAAAAGTDYIAGGVGSATQIAYFSNTGILTGSSSFTYNGGNLNFGTSAATIGMTAQSSGDTTGANLTVKAGAGHNNGAGGNLTLQGGTSGSGTGNGGNLLLYGGTSSGSGLTGLVVLGTPVFYTTTNDANCYTGGTLVATSCTITTSTVNNSSAAIVGFSTTGQTAALPDPTDTTIGKIFYVTSAPGSSTFTLSVNGGGIGNVVSMRADTTVTMIWNGSNWAAAGASSSTDLQAAYDNILQTAGGAELVVSHTSFSNGLTIRDSSVNPVNGPLMSIQTNSAATLFSVSSNVTEFASDAGAETAGGSSSTFPSNTWGSLNSASVYRYTTVGNYIATGQASVAVATPASASSGVKNTLTSALAANQHYNVSFAVRLSSGTFTDMFVYYSKDGSDMSIECTTDQAVITSVWTKVNCSFGASSSGITSSNAILIGQTSGVSRTFYIDNLSVTIAADYNYATDGGVDDNTNFATNWTSVNSATVSRETNIGYNASSSAKVVTTTSNQGISNLLSVNPLTSSLYLVTIYAASTTSGFDNFTVTYTPNGTDTVACVDYNTQTISSSTSSFTKVTCYIQTNSTTVTSPHVRFTQTDSTGRTFYVDAFSITLSTATTPNVHIGSGVNGGPTTLFTLDSAASAPIASDNESLLGSMYYDTSLGKLQCYQAAGWGSCGSISDTVVTISPEYTNAVLHGTGIGTMTSDICSGTLHINDGSSGQPNVCGTNDTYNFYKWTSPQATSQTYSIYVTYQLPQTFKEFYSNVTSIMGLTDSSNSTVSYEVYRQNSSSGLTQCGSSVTVSTGSQSSWQTGVATGAADPSTCNFAAGDSIIFKINLLDSQNSNSYVGNLNFTFSNN